MSSEAQLGADQDSISYKSLPSGTEKDFQTKFAGTIVKLIGATKYHWDIGNPEFTRQLDSAIMTVWPKLFPSHANFVHTHRHVINKLVRTAGLDRPFSFRLLTYLQISNKLATWRHQFGAAGMESVQKEFDALGFKADDYELIAYYTDSNTEGPTHKFQFSSFNEATGVRFPGYYEDLIS